MEEVRILLLDLDVESGMSSALQEILESCGKPRIHLEERSIDIHEFGLLSNEISNSAFSSHSHLLFLVVPSNYPEHASTLIQSLRRERINLPIVIVLEEGKPDRIMEFFRLGVADFLTPPFRMTDVLPRIWRLTEPKSPEDLVVHSVKEKVGLKQLVGKDPAFLAEIEKIPLVAKCDASVLILGETGTGKELCARAR